MEANQAPIRLIPEITPELIAEHTQKQVEWKARVQEPDYVREPALARLRSESIELNLLLGEWQQGIRSPMRGNRIAEILATKGLLRYAADIASDGYKELYTAYAEAIDRPDEEKCPHYDARLGRTWFVEREKLVSTRHSQTVPLLKCNVCAFRNARPFTAAESCHMDIVSTDSK